MSEEEVDSKTAECVLATREQYAKYAADEIADVALIEMADVALRECQVLIYLSL